METRTYKIRGMDCADEIASLKRELGPIVGGADRIAFDLLNGKITVDVVDDALSEQALITAVARTGMQATPWDQHAKVVSQGVGQRHGRLIVTVVGAFATSTGFVIHAVFHGFVDALATGVSTRHEFPLVSIGLYVIGIVCSGWYIFPKAWRSARRLRPDMNLLMTVAVVGAAAIGEWFEAAVVTVLFSIALLLESWSVGRAWKAISALMDLSPPTASCFNADGQTERKPVMEVAIGTRVLVRPGEKVPLDGTVTKGSTTLNQAPITGESRPVSKEVGDDVFAGTINEEGAFEFETTKEPNDMTIARIIRMVEEAQSRRAPSEQWVERLAHYYTPCMMALSVLLMVVPPIMLAGEWSTWFYKGLVLLVIACPCALVISTPVSIVAGLSAAARKGVLVKGGTYLEAPAHLKAIALDKTGTLTRGEPEVQAIIPLSGHTERELLECAAALEVNSKHPLARAILRKAQAEGVSAKPAEQFQAIRGKGAKGYIDGRLFWIGNHRLLHEQAVEEEQVHEEASRLEDAGHSVIIIGNDAHVCGLISVADLVRHEARGIVSTLKNAGIERIVMLTGDNEGTSRAVAEATGVDEARAELLPEDKVRAVEALVATYERVAMVGDGVNDAPAMASATLGIAMGAAGTDAALETADIALMSDDLSKIHWLIHHSRRTLRVVKQNITFALGVKAIFIVLSLGGVATLWMAIAADMGASFLVIFNGLRLLQARSVFGSR